MVKIQSDLEMLERMTSSIKQKIKCSTLNIDSFYEGIECLLHVLYQSVEYEDLGEGYVKFPAEWLPEISQYIQHLRIYEKVDEYDYED